MARVTDARAELVAALNGIDPAKYEVELAPGFVANLAPLRVYDDPAATVDPPGVMVSLPDLRREAFGPVATTAVFEVAVIAAVSDRALEQLAEYEQIVATAIYDNTGAVAETSRAGAWLDQLPAYLIEVEYPL